MIDISNKMLMTSLVDQFAIDLSGLSVYTEAASGAYLLAPVAGAKKVYA